jgi:hypothetical protein
MFIYKTICSHMCTKMFICLPKKENRKMEKIYVFIVVSKIYRFYSFIVFISHMYVVK